MNGLLSKPYPQPCLNPVPWTVDHGPGLLEPFLNQIWTLLKGGWAAVLGRWSVDRGPWLMDWQRQGQGVLFGANSPYSLSLHTHAQVFVLFLAELRSFFLRKNFCVLSRQRFHSSRQYWSTCGHTRDPWAIRSNAFMKCF